MKDIERRKCLLEKRKKIPMVLVYEWPKRMLVSYHNVSRTVIMQ